jgi:hypothetical protein
MQVPCGYNQLSSFSGAAIGVGRGLSVVTAAAVAAGGSGYAVNDQLTVSGGAAEQSAVLKVTSVDGNGAVLAAVVVIPGVYTSKPSNSASTTGGSGSGATANLTWADNAIPAGAVWAELTVEGANVRWRNDGTDPTSTVGNLLTIEANGMTPFVYRGPLSALKVIGVSSGSILNVQFGGVRRQQ